VAAVAGLVASGYAAAASVIVTLGPSGPQPSRVTVAWGDTLQIVNGDSVAHGLASPRADLRAATVAPGATFTDVVTGRAGTVAYHQTGGKRQDGAVVVALSGSVSLQAADETVLFGKQLSLSGTTNAGVPVAIAERLAGEPAWHTVVTVTSDAAGAFSAGLPLPLGGRFRASVEGNQVRSKPVRVKLAPQLTLSASPRRGKPGRRIRLRARVVPATAASRVYLYACVPAITRWHRIRSARTAGGVAVFRGRFLPGRFKLRATLKRHDVAAGYATRTSAAITVRGTGKAPHITHRSTHHC
jgi:hypothetical protein